MSGKKSYTPDTLYMIGSKLKGSEIIKMCSSDTETRRICMSQKFNPLWTRKLLEDFNVVYEGNNAYMEYLQYSYLYKKTYWVASIYERGDIINTKIFKNRKDGVLFLVNQILKDTTHYSHAECFATISTFGEYENNFHNKKYSITVAMFSTENQETKDSILYEGTFRKIYDIITSGKEKDDIPVNGKKEDFEDFKIAVELIIAEETPVDSFEDVFEYIKTKILDNDLDDYYMEDIENLFRQLLNR